MYPGKRQRNVPRRTAAWLVGILCVALVLRILYLLQARDHLFFNAFSDSLYYHQWALRIIGGQHGPQVFYMGPLYPYLLAIWYGLLGPHAELFLWFQVLLGTISCGLLYWLGRLVFGPAVGLLAACMGAIYRVEVFYEGLLLMATVLFFLHLLLLISVSVALDRDRFWRWLFCGLLMGLSALGRANVLAFLPLVLVGILAITKGPGSRVIRLGAAGAVLVGVFVVLAPVTIHNYLVGGDLVPITSNLGMNFYIGNHQRASGYYVKPKGLDLAEDIYGTKIANLYAGRGLKPSEVSRFWLRRGLDFVTAHFGSFLKLMANKAVLFWNAYEIPQVENLSFLGRFVPLLRWPLLGFSVLGPLGLLGMGLSLGRWRRSYYLLAFVTAFFVTALFFFVISRLRLQVCSALMVFAAYALVWMGREIGQRHWQRVIAALVALAAAALFVNWPYSILDRPHHLAQAHRLYALHLRQAGQLSEAAREYHRAMAIDPDLADSYVDLASLRMEQGDRQAALQLYQQALRIDPDVSGVHLNFGNVYARQGLWQQAIAEFRKETQASPYSFKAYESLYRALKEAGRSTSDSTAAGSPLPSQPR